METTWSHGETGEEPCEGRGKTKRKPTLNPCRGLRPTGATQGPVLFLGLGGLKAFLNGFWAIRCFARRLPPSSFPIPGGGKERSGLGGEKKFISPAAGASDSLRTHSRCGCGAPPPQKMGGDTCLTSSFRRSSRAGRSCRNRAIRCKKFGAPHFPHQSVLAPLPQIFCGDWSRFWPIGPHGPL